MIKTSSPATIGLRSNPCSWAIKSMYSSYLNVFPVVVKELPEYIVPTTPIQTLSYGFGILTCTLIFLDNKFLLA